MNSTQRVMATLAGEAVDRRAVAPVLSLYGARLTDCPLEKYYADTDAYVRGQDAVYDTFRPDVLFSPFAFASLGAAFGSQVRFFADQAPNVRRPAIASIDKLDTLAIPDPEANPQLLFIRHTIQHMVDRYRGEVPIAVPLPPSTDLPALILGIENWLDAVLFDPAATRRMLDRITPFYIQFVNSLLADGASFVVFTCCFASPVIVSRSIVTSFTRPVLSGFLGQIRGPVVLHHAGSPLLANLDLLAGLPSTIGYAVDPREDLAQARQKIGPGPLLLAGPPGPSLVTMTPDEVVRATLEILENRRPDPHFVLNTAGPDVSWQTAAANIHAVRQAAELFGGFVP